MTRIAVIDHGAGNLVSMDRALTRVGAEPVRITRARTLGEFDGIILPGVGATGAAMRSLERSGLIEPLRSYDGPLLGVCVGMQLLFEHSKEDDNPCLGLLEGTVEPIASRPLPHMGWNDVTPGDPLVPTDAVGRTFYFVHSYAVAPTDVDVITATTSYGGVDFPSIVRKGPIVGVQFHPERSAAPGQDVLARFIDECGSERRVA